jgi:fructose-1,6-bisphosphatase II
MDRNLALEFVRVTEAAAIAAARWVGRGDKHKADGAAVDEMRARFNQIEFSGRVVIGEGAKDEAPELYTGEKVGKGNGPTMDLAVDPLEATDSVAYGRYNALSVIVAGPRGSLLSAPDTYMNKIAAGPRAAKVIKLEAPVKVNIYNVARALGKPVKDIVVVVLDRERHKGLIQKIRQAGARVRLITDGDVAAAIATCLPDSGIDLLMGIGGSTEAVLAAAPVKLLGGQILCQFAPRSKDDEKAIRQSGTKNLKKVFRAEDLAHGKQLTFTATGVIDGPLLQGVRFSSGGGSVSGGQAHIITHSMVLRGSSGTLRYITTYHHQTSKK